MSLLVP